MIFGGTAAGSILLNPPHFLRTCDPPDDWISDDGRGIDRARVKAAAIEIGAKAVGVILTGMGADGSRGLFAMRKAGARTIGQNEASCVVYGMPKVAHQIGAVETQPPLHAIAAEIAALDHISQKILAVADFLQAFGEGLPGDWRVDAHTASRCVLLAELGARLGAPESAKTPAPERSAECEMF